MAQSQKETFPCGTPKPEAETTTEPTSGSDAAPEHDLRGKPVTGRPITSDMTTFDVLRDSMPAFGGRLVSNVYRILERVVEEDVPLVIAIAGPVTVSRQHHAWLIPLLKMGHVAYLTVTDAICYHDGHDILKQDDAPVIYETLIEGLDLEYRKANIIRVTDCGFDERILFDQDRMISAILMQPEFQRKMAGPEFRHLLGLWYGKLEKATGTQPGLLSTCADLGIPVFCGAPGDGSTFLNATKLRAMRDAGIIPRFDFELDIYAEVLESCAYHLWGLRTGKKQLAVLILGGGVCKNFTLQPEPALSQIFLLDNIRGYDFDVQIVGAQVTDGSLTSCKPAEAHTWGKVSKEALVASTESVNGADYSTIMPFIVHGLLQRRAEAMNRHPHRLYDKRDGLVAELMNEIKTKGPELLESIRFPLVPAPAAG